MDSQIDSYENGDSGLINTSKQLHSDVNTTLIEHLVASHYHVNHLKSKAVYELAKDADMNPKDYWDKYHEIVIDVYNQLLEKHHFDEKVLTGIEVLNTESEYIQYLPNHKTGKYQYYLHESFWIDAIDNGAFCEMVCIPPNSGKTQSLGTALKIIDSPQSDSDFKGFHAGDLHGRSAMTQTRQSPLWDDLGFDNQYFEDGSTGNITESSFKADKPVRFSITINSLPSALKKSQLIERDGKKIVIFDEITQVLSQLHGEACQSKFIEASQAIKTLLANVDKVLVLDASLTNSQVSLFKHFFLPVEKQHDVRIRQFNIEKWHGVKAVFTENHYKFAQIVRQETNKTLRAIANGKRKGLHIYFNRNTVATAFINQLVSDLTPLLKKDEKPRYYVDSTLIDDLGVKGSKLKFKIAFYYKPDRSSNSRIDVHEIDFAKKGYKAVSTFQIPTSEFNAKPSETLEKHRIHILCNTPSMERGVSADNSPHFDTVIANIKPSFKTSGADGGYQGITRMRDATKWFVYVETLKELKEGYRTLDCSDFDTVDDVSNSIYDENEEIKELIPPEILHAVQNDKAMCDQLAGYIRDTKLSQHLYAPLLFRMVSDSVGHDNVYIDNFTGGSVKIAENGNTNSSRDLRIHTLINCNDDMSVKDFKDWTESRYEASASIPPELYDAYELTELKSYVSLSHDNYNKMILLKDGTQANWQDMSKETQFETLANAMMLRDIARNAETAITLADKKNLEKFQRATVASSLTLSKSDNNTKLLINPLAKKRKQAFDRAARNTSVVKGLLSVYKCDNFEQLINMPSYDHIVIDDKVARKIIGVSDTSKPFTTLNNALKDLGLEYVTNRKRGFDNKDSNDNRARVRILKRNDTLDFYKNRTRALDFKESEYTKAKSKKGDERFKRLLKMLDI